MPKSKNVWPSWFYGPDGQSGVFEEQSEVPKGWVTDPAGPTKPASSKAKPAAAKKKSQPKDDNALTREEAISLLSEAGVDLEGDVSDDELQALLEEHLGDDDK